LLSGIAEKVLCCRRIDLRQFLLQTGFTTGHSLQIFFRLAGELLIQVSCVGLNSPKYFGGEVSKLIYCTLLILCVTSSGE
jgi:hypothetical protein